MEGVTEDNLIDLESHIGKHHRNMIANLKCIHFETYSKISTGSIFQFLPGHRKLILALKHQIATEKKSNVLDMTISRWFSELKDKSIFSNLLKELVTSAINNFEKTPNNHRYSEILRNFATYLYLQSGKQSYELISKNLPFPAVSTVCKLGKILVSDAF